MSTFHDNFQPDPELDGERRLWRTGKPLLRHAVVEYAPPYPEYPKLKVSKSRGPSSDPSCPSARDVGDDIEVAMYSDDGRFGEAQELAWNFIIDNVQAIEAALRRKLFAQHLKFREQFLTEELSKREQKYWNEIQSQVELDEASAIDSLFKLVRIGLADHGLDECGFSSFEFQTGWDQDHGMGILMHKNSVLSAGGMEELICRGHHIVGAVKSVQTYDLDDGDLSLLNK